MATWELRDRLQAALGDAYSVERELPAGGMSRLFLATERSLDRRVVIKLLPPEYASEVSAARFQREITVTAHLQYPHILPILSAGSNDGLLYYVMPYVEGESLRQRLDREGKLPVAVAVQILREIADALARAHNAGIVHRDIKPENVLLQDNHALLGDFGVARALREATGGQRLTDTGLGLGTPGYMAPEQLAGDPNVDARADVYALAVVGYEMLAGASPFAGATPQATAAAHFTEAPKPLHQVRSEVPTTVSNTIARALAKDPHDRFSSASEFQNALTDMTSASIGRRGAWRWAAAAAVCTAGILGATQVWRIAHRGETGGDAGPVPLAVLPFENLGDSADATFADGVTDAVRGKLAALPQLLVIARTSSGQYRRTTRSPQQIGRELGVRYLVIGRVRWARDTANRDRVQVSPELIDATNAGEKWQGAFDAPLTDVFRVQGDIATRVAQALQIALSPAAQQALTRAPTTSLDAYDAYVRAEALFTIVDDRQLHEMIALYRRAIALDSNFSVAYVGLATALLILHDDEPDSSLLPQAKRAVDHAARLTPGTAETVFAQGVYQEQTGDLAGAIERYRVAYRLDPNFTKAHFFAGDIVGYLGRWDEALQEYTRAVTLNPGDWSYHTRAGDAYLALRQYQAAEREFDRAVALAPQAALPYLEKGKFLIRARADTAGATRLLDTAIARTGAEAVARMLAGPWLLLRVPDAVGQVNVNAFDGDTTSYYLLRSGYYQSIGATDRARTFADSARARLERTIGKGRNVDLGIELAMVYEALGRTRDAAREIDSAAADIAAGPATAPGAADMVKTVQAYVRVRSGDVDGGLAELQDLLDHPSLLSRAALKVDPHWSFFGDDPRFQRLIEDSKPSRL